MKVFVDIVTGDELMSDTFKYTLEFNDVIMKVQSTYKFKENVGNVDIGCGNAFGGGDEDGGADGEAQVKVIDVAFNANLVETTFSKAEFTALLKAYMKKIIDHLTKNGNEARVEVFKKGATDFFTKIKDIFDEVSFYLGSSEDTEGGIVISYWETEESTAPVFYFFKDGLKEVKC